jgi:hypothetical protein
MNNLEMLEYNIWKLSVNDNYIPLTLLFISILFCFTFVAY